MLFRCAGQGEGLKVLFHLEETECQFCCTEAAQDEETGCEAFGKLCDLQNSHSVSPANIGIFSCNTAITKKNYLFLQKAQGLCLVGNANVDGRSLCKCLYVWIEW